MKRLHLCISDARIAYGEAVSRVVGVWSKELMDIERWIDGWWGSGARPCCSVVEQTCQLAVSGNRSRASCCCCCSCIYVDDVYMHDVLPLPPTLHHCRVLTDGWLYAPSKRRFNLTAHISVSRNWTNGMHSKHPYCFQTLKSTH